MEDLDEKVGTAVKVHDGDFAYYGIASVRQLSLKEKFGRLSKEQQDEILNGEKTVADFYEARNESNVDGLDALREVCGFIDRYKDPLAESTDARKVLAVRCIAQGVPATDVLDLVGVNFHTLQSWCAPTVKGKKSFLIDQKLVKGIEKSVKDAKASNGG